MQSIAVAQAPITVASMLVLPILQPPAIPLIRELWLIDQPIAAFPHSPTPQETMIAAVPVAFPQATRMGGN